MTHVSRRELLALLGAASAVPLLGRGQALGQDQPSFAPVPAKSVYVARNGTPVTNVQAVIDMIGGIHRVIGYDDIVVLKPNGQWSRQGYTHTLCIKALIDLILHRPGGFAGEIVIAEHVHRRSTGTDNAYGTNYCWNMSVGGRANNWPKMNYLELVAFYNQNGFPNVWADPMFDANDGNWVDANPANPSGVPADRQGWVVAKTATHPGSGRSYILTYPIFRSPFSNKLIDLNKNGGVWENGGYNGQKVRLIFLPTLNNHGSNSQEDYAGITSAVKCHIGFQRATSMHSVGYSNNRPDAVGNVVGELITEVMAPTFYLTCAEYTGHASRTGAATWTKTIGLCADPVCLDFWMAKYILFPCTNLPHFNPDIDNNTRKTLVGCNAKGVGTLIESEMIVHQRNLA